MHLAIVFNFLIALQVNRRTIIERESIGRILEVLLFNQHALERFRIKPERRTTLEALLVGIGVDPLEVFVRVIRRRARSTRQGDALATLDVEVDGSAALEAEVREAQPYF